MESVIEAHNLSMKFPKGRELFGGFSIQIPKYEFVSILGPSGCGKSTLLRILAGLLDPTQGEVKRTTQHLGFVFQDPELLPWRTVHENVRLPLELTQSQGDPDSWIQRVGLQAAGNLYPRELSGGMRMRTSLARALTRKAECLFFDEPFSALDEPTRFSLQEEVRQLQVQSFTALFVTHSLSEALFLSDRILVLDANGHLRESISVDGPVQRTRGFRAEARFFEQLSRLLKAFERNS